MVDKKIILESYLFKFYREYKHFLDVHNQSSLLFLIDEILEIACDKNTNSKHVDLLLSYLKPNTKQYELEIYDPNIYGKIIPELVEEDYDNGYELEFIGYGEYGSTLYLLGLLAIKDGLLEERFKSISIPDWLKIILINLITSHTDVHYCGKIFEGSFKECLDAYFDKIYKLLKSNKRNYSLYLKQINLELLIDITNIINNNDSKEVEVGLNIGKQKYKGKVYNAKVGNLTITADIPEYITDLLSSCEITQGYCQDTSFFNSTTCNLEINYSRDFNILELELNYNPTHRDIWCRFAGPLDIYLYLNEDMRDEKISKKKFLDKKLFTDDKMFLKEGRLVYKLGSLDIKNLTSYFKL